MCEGRTGMARGPARSGVEPAAPSADEAARRADPDAGLPGDNAGTAGEGAGPAAGPAVTAGGAEPEPAGAAEPAGAGGGDARPKGDARRLADRYRLDERLSDEGGSSVWKATDKALARAVTVRTFEPGFRRLGQVVAAARAASQLNDRRLVQIFDADDSPEHRYIVSEWPSGERLDDVLAIGPLEPRRAVEIIIEAAGAIAVAQAAGLAHLCLTPDCVWCNTRSEVKITGLATEAALAGTEADDQALADTRGLASLLYAALTGYWPGEQQTRLPAAPHSAGRVASPRELHADVPRDIDAITCRALSGDASGDEPPILSPAGLAIALAATGISARSAPLSQAPNVTQPLSLSFGRAAHPRRSLTPPAARKPGLRRRGAPAAGPAGPGTSPARPGADPPRPLTKPLTVKPTTASGAANAWPAPPPVSPRVSPPGPSGSAPASPGPAGTASTGTASTGVASTGTASTGTAGTGTADVGPAAAGPGTAGPGSASFGTAGRATPGPATATGSAAAAAPSNPGPARAVQATASAPAGTGPAGPAPAGPGRTVVAKASRVAAVLLVIAVSMAGGWLLAHGVTTPHATVGVTAPAHHALRARTVIPASAATFDPYGDGQGAGAAQLAQQAIDDSPTTAWHTAWYTTAMFGNLKPGTGLLLDMGRPVTITGIKITLGSLPGADFQVRTGAAAASLADTHPVTRVTGAGGQVDRQLTTPARGARYVLIWFTRLPPDASGTFQATVYNVSLKGSG